MTAAFERGILYHRTFAANPAARLQRSTMDNKRKSGGGFELDDRAAKRRKVPLVSFQFL